MPKLTKIETDAAYTPSPGEVVTFFAEEAGNIVLKAKKFDGTIATLSGGGVGDVTLGQIDADGNFQPLSFVGTEASNAGDPETVDSYYGWNGTLPSPTGGINVGEATEYYKCANIAQGAQYYEVSGATAYPDCNGNYYLTDIISPIDGVSPVWKHETKIMYLFGVYEIAQITPDYTGDSGNLYLAHGYTGGTFPTSGWQDVDFADMGLSVAFKTAPPTEKTWSGYRAVYTEADGYTFEDTVTTGLVYGGGLVPEVGKIYDADAKIIVSKLFETVKPITTNDTSCLIYIDGTALSNQALAPDKHEVTFGSGVNLADGYVNLTNDSTGQILTTAKNDGYGGALTEWTWDFYFLSDATYLCCTGHSVYGWTLEGSPGQELWFRGKSNRLGVTYTQNELVGLSMQWDNGTLHVWDKGKYVGTCALTFANCTGQSFGIGCIADGDYDRMADKLKLFRFSNKARYTPGVDFELPDGFTE